MYIIMITILVHPGYRNKHTNTQLQNNIRQIHNFIRVSKVHCGRKQRNKASAARFGQALSGFPITAHHLCAFLM